MVCRDASRSGVIPETAIEGHRAGKNQQIRAGNRYRRNIL
jgi:hypothetical protein